MSSPFSPVRSILTDWCHDWPYSVVQLLPGGWDTGDETDHAKEILLWVRDWHQPTREATHSSDPLRTFAQFTRIVLAIQVLSAGVTLPCKYILRRGVYRSLAVLLGPVMLLAVIVTGLAAKL
jgi:hypothetical protein